MKRFLALFMSLLFAVSLCSCSASSGSGKSDNPEATATDGETHTIFGNYSINSTDDSFYVKIPEGSINDCKDTEILVKFYKNDENIYDAKGNSITKDDIKVGDLMMIYFEGKLSDDDPATITVYKIELQ